MDTKRAMSDWTRTALDAVREAVFALDPNGCVSFENRAAEQLTGIGIDVARNRRLSEVLELRDPATGRPLEFDLPRNGHSASPLIQNAILTRADGTEHRLEAHLDPVPGENGSPSGSVLVLSEPAGDGADPELLRRSEELVAADRRKDQFLAMLAHELRNPLAPIRNAVELMRQVETVDPSFQPSREMVERQVKHLARLVDDLLDVSRLTQGSIRLRKEPVDLGDAVERAADSTRPLIDSRNHTLTLDLPAKPIRLEGDAARLEQVVSNLLNNAAKYTMPGGHIRLGVDKEGEEAVIRVRDNGIGVPPDVLGRVFEPFVQSDGSLARSEGGLGIGLTLVRSLVEMHGGTVEAHSPGLGQGSEFVIRLPIRLPNGASVSAPEPSFSRETNPFTPARPVRVLVVEDNVDAAESLATLLRLWGHDVRVVHDGLEALDAAQAYQPEVVLLDIGLPGLDGYQVAERLRSEVGLDHALLVAMTGYGQPEDRRRSREAGIDHHFVKPVEPFVLRNLLAEVASPVGSPVS
jgi:signal transduction histidine kinase/CheY-like chemotaxis protein